jgi:DNA-binding MarR family transcriptional regulator
MQEPAALLISAIRRRLKQVVGAQVRAYGLSPAQFWILNRIFECEGLSLRELAGSLYMDQPTTSRVVSTLAAHKLVRMEGDPADRRRGRLVPTARGRALAAKLHRIALETRGAVESGLTAAERDTLRALLRKALAHIDELH